MIDHVMLHILRTILMYAIAAFAIRLMGKREIGKLSVFDLVISIMLAEIAVFAIEDVKRPLYEGLVPIITLIVLQVCLAFFGLKSRWFRLAMDGKPVILVSDGKLQRDEMKRQRYNLDDLMLQLREQNVDNIDDLQFAILETTGKLSVVIKDEQKGSEHNDFPQINKMADSGQEQINLTNIRYEALPLPLIMDGKVQDANLEMIEKNRFWLKNQIQEHGVKDFKDVFFCSVDHAGKIYVNTQNSNK
ncbi:DUF421 domain-containing protein [Neobacillus mesonae]|nr:DUF421 domain-containing protein [Neobacillus mesonae]